MRKTYAVLILAFIVGISMSFMLSCNSKSSPTGPSLPGDATSQPGTVSPSDTTTPAVTPAEPTNIDIKIKGDGTVVNNSGTTYTACLFDAPYGEGKLADQWLVKAGRTPMEYENETCEEQKPQLDIIDAKTCPPTPHGLSPIAARILDPLPPAPECAECEEEAEIVKVERGEEGDWGECEESRPEAEASTDVPQCSKSREVEFITHWKQCDKTWTTTETRPEYERCECPCVDEWRMEQEPEIIEGKWSECVAPEEPFDESAFAAFAGVTASTHTPAPELCYGERTRTDILVWYETSSCTKERREAKREERVLTEKCEVECPYAEGYCFYNVSGRIKEATCRLKLGGNPLAFGQWGRWPDGPPSDHCRFTVPGIYSDTFRQFQLTPGQSDPRCNNR